MLFSYGIATFFFMGLKKWIFLRHPCIIPPTSETNETENQSRKNLAINN
jgi:hypothetical protein